MAGTIFVYIILFLVLAYPNHTLYYKGISMRIEGGITYVDMEYGIFYYWWVISSSMLVWTSLFYGRALRRT